MLDWFWRFFTPAKTLHVDVCADDGARVNVFIGSNVQSDIVTDDDTSDDDIVGVDVGVDVDDSQHSDEGNQSDS